MINKKILFLTISIFGLAKCGNRFEPTMITFPSATIDKFYYKDGTSILINVSAERLWADKSFDQYGKTVELLSNHGLFNFEKFAKTQLVSASTDTLTSEIHEKIFSKTADFRSYVLNNPGILSKVQTKGKLEIYEVNVAGKFFSKSFPFYASANIPVRFLDLSNISLICGISDSVNAQLTQNFNDMIMEHGYKSILETYSARSFSDATLSIGYQDIIDFNHSLVSGSSYDISFGLIAPLSETNTKETKYFFDVPLGNGGSFGTNLKCKGDISFKKNIELGAYLEVDTFFKSNDTIPVQHNKDIPFLQLWKKSEVDIYRGSCWTAGGYFKGQLGARSCAIIIGYNYISQEQTTLDLVDSEREKKDGFYDFVKITDIKTNQTTSTTERQDRINRTFYYINNDLINQDPKLQRSYMHVAYFGIKAQAPKNMDWCDNAKISMNLSIPIYGKGSFMTKGFGFEFGLGMSF